MAEEMQVLEPGRGPIKRKFGNKQGRKMSRKKPKVMAPPRGQKKVKVDKKMKKLSLISSKCLMLLLIKILLLPKTVMAEPRAKTVLITCGNQLAHNTTIFVTAWHSAMDKISEQMRNTGFGTAVTGTPPDTNYVLAQCYGDLSLLDCVLCYSEARTVFPHCYRYDSSRIYLDGCFMRSENYPFFNEYVGPGDRAVCGKTTKKNSNFQAAAKQAVLKAVLDAPKNKGYARGKVAVSGTVNESAYVLVDCWKNLDTRSCKACLENASSSILGCLPWSEGRALNTGCFMRYSDKDFLNKEVENGSSGVKPAFEDNTKSSGKHQNVSIIVVSIVASIVLLSLSFSCYLLRKKVRKSNYKTLLRKNFGDESTAIEGLQFDLALVKAATNNFSQENKIGKGGFGEVYKGILPDGRQIAVKRLLRNSKQGLVEFKTEILLIAKLQQRNLVALIGFCLEEQEKILIYEFVPNGSLDSFLFGTQQQMLSWTQRYKIIGGTALGILYLHEYSRLKVIHRDLKPSNILLDENMNPKISDFGMARIVEIDEDRGNTNKIAGTFGYMSPEYAMLGQFSEKSDVFSFGVMVLEIITGKRNINSYESHHIAENVISYVWREWKKQTPLSVLDTNMDENYSQNEIVKCIQIGLLCVQENPNARPTMATIVSYLNSHSPELPSPQEPGFFLNDTTDQDITAQQETSFDQSTNNFISSSINEMSISEFYPRE